MSQPVSPERKKIWVENGIFQSKQATNTGSYCHHNLVGGPESGDEPKILLWSSKSREKRNATYPPQEVLPEFLCPDLPQKSPRAAHWSFLSLCPDSHTPKASKQV